MSLVHPLRAFPPKPHADSHEYGGDDPVTDLDRLLIRGTEVIDASRNLKNIASGDIAGNLNVGGSISSGSLVSVSKSSGYAFYDMERSDLPQLWSLRINDSKEFFIYDVTNGVVTLKISPSTGNMNITGNLNVGGVIYPSKAVAGADGGIKYTDEGAYLISEIATQDRLELYREASTGDIFWYNRTDGKTLWRLKQDTGDVETAGNLTVGGYINVPSNKLKLWDGLGGIQKNDEHWIRLVYNYDFFTNSIPDTTKKSVELILGDGDIRFVSTQTAGGTDWLTVLQLLSDGSAKLAGNLEVGGNIISPSDDITIDSDFIRLLRGGGLNSFHIVYDGTPERRGIAITPDPDGRFRFYINSNQSNAQFEWIDGNTGNLLAKLTKDGNLEVRGFLFSNGGAVARPSTSNVMRVGLGTANFARNGAWIECFGKDYSGREGELTLGCGGGSNIGVIKFKWYDGASWHDIATLYRTGDLEVGGDLKVNGGDIKDSDGDVRIIFDSAATQIADQNGNVRLTATAAPALICSAYVYPVEDNHYNLGTSAYRWKDFYAVNKHAAFPLKEDNVAYVMHCVEAPKFYLIDVGHGKIGEDGKCNVVFREEFAVLISDILDYHVFLQSYSGKRLAIAEKHEFGFVVEGEPHEEFDWMVVAVRLGDEEVGGKEEIHPDAETEEFKKWLEEKVQMARLKEEERRAKIKNKMDKYRTYVGS